MLFSHGRSQPLTKYFAILEPRLTSFALSAIVNMWILRLWKWSYFLSCDRWSLYPAASIIPRAGRPASVSEVAPATHVSNSDRAGAWPTFAKKWSILAPQHPPRFHFKNLMNPVHCMNGSCNIFRLHKKCWLSNTEISQKKWGWNAKKKKKSIAICIRKILESLTEHFTTQKRNPSKSTGLGSLETLKGEFGCSIIAIYVSPEIHSSYKMWLQKKKNHFLLLFVRVMLTSKIFENNFLFLFVSIDQLM